MTLPSRSGATRIALLSLIALSACKKDGGTPAYIQLGTPVVLSAEGDTISSKITDLWVYANDEPAGVWESGRHVPLLSSGPTTVKLIAGVRKNGMVDSRIQYPFYATYAKDLDLVPEQTISITPVFHYYSDVDFWTQDFEGGFQFDTLDSRAGLTTVPADGSLIGQGSYSGSVLLDSDHNTFKCVSGGDAFLVPPSTDAFLEMDYRSDLQMLIGVRYQVNGQQYDASYVYVNPTGSSPANWYWNKIYIDLGSAWSVTGAVAKRFYISAELGSATSGHIQLDNVKLVRP